MKPFCVKTKVIGYAIFEVGRSKKEEDGEIGGFSRCLVMISAVYSSYFRGIFGYRNAPKPSLGVYKGLSFEGFCMLRLMGVSAPSLHRESTDSLILELMNLLHGNKILPGRISSLTLLVLMSSVLTNYESVRVCIWVQVLVEEYAVEK